MSSVPAQRLTTVHDAQATRDLRSKILQSDALSTDLSNAIADVFKKHGIVPDDQSVVALEPIVSKVVPAGQASPIHPGSALLAAATDPAATIHVVETRSLVRNYAVTASAWT